MENTKHPVILEINLLSKIMPYYGYAHLMFLVLSKLSKKSRKFLAEWYQEFRGFSLECGEEKKVSINYISKLIEPTDLFKYIIIYDWPENNVRGIITLIDRLSKKEGMKFEGKYMNERLCLTKIYFNPENIRDLYPYVELLESINVVNNTRSNEKDTHSLLDQIILNDVVEYLNRDDSTITKICYFKDDEGEQIDETFKPFKRIYNLKFRSVNDAHYILEKIKHANIVNVESISFIQLSYDEIEEVLVPFYFNYKVQKIIIYNCYKGDQISNKCLKNIKTINPEELYLTNIITITSFIRILKMLPYGINVYFERKHGTNLDTLTFKNVIIPLKVKSDSFQLSGEVIDFEYSSVQEIVLLDDKNFCLRNFKNISVQNLNEETISTSYNVESLPPMYSKIGGNFIIPVNNLCGIKLSLGKLTELLKNDRNKTYLPTLSIISKFIIYFEDVRQLKLFEGLSSFVPKHGELEINSPVYFDKSKEERDSNIALFLRIASKFKLSPFTLKLEDPAVDFEILSKSSIKRSLKHLFGNKYSIFSIKDILDICANCSILETITIRYFEYDSLFGSEITDAIKNVKIRCPSIKSILLEPIKGDKE